jgi:hypothetical protein
VQGLANAASAVLPPTFKKLCFVFLRGKVLGNVSGYERRGKQSFPHPGP